MGKGSTRRPSQVPPSVEADNWARTFGGKPQHDLDAQREHGRVGFHLCVCDNTGWMVDIGGAFVPCIACPRDVAVTANVSVYG